MNDKKQEFEFGCNVDFDGFKIGNEFDSDGLIRAFGYKNYEQVAYLKFISKEKYQVEVNFSSIGDQEIFVCIDDASVEVAKKYYDENKNPTKEQLEDFLAEFENSFNMCELSTKKQALMYLELNKKKFIEYKNSSWIEANVKIIDTNGFLIHYDFYGRSLFSIEECKPTSFAEIQKCYVDENKEFFNRRAEVA